MGISGKTKVCAIIGDPVEHSLSPVIQNAAFKELGLNLIYVAFTVTTRELQTAILGARSLGIRGLNVTMPHKKAVINYLDEVDSTAKSIGAVNTVINNNGRLIGYNTDGNGAIIALQKNGVYLKEKKLVLLGAGGTAKAIAYKAAQDVGQLIILNRNLENSKKLVEMLQKAFGKKVRGGVLSSKILEEELETTDILVNATSVGMHPNVNISPVPSNLLTRDLCVMDIVYNPQETKLALDAKSVGAKVVSGIEMLIYQGAIAFEIWTNCPAPVGIMRDAVLNQLQKQGVYC